jgi:hypothetical protein
VSFLTRASHEIGRVRVAGGTARSPSFVPRKAALRRMTVLLVVTLAFVAITSDASALTAKSSRGSTGRVFLHRNPYTGVTPQIRCDWAGPQAYMSLPGFYVNRARNHWGVRQVIWARYRIRQWDGSKWVSLRSLTSSWYRDVIGRYQKRTLFTGILNIPVARANAYSVWIYAVWEVRPRNPRWIGSKVNYMNSFDFSELYNFDPFNPITFGGGNSVGWCQFS